MLNPVTFKTACRVCRDRKVKCDKTLPCRNCTMADIVCSFPPQVRTVRRPKRAGGAAAKLSSASTDQSVMDRLDRLEELLRRHAPHLLEGCSSRPETADITDATNATHGSLSPSPETIATPQNNNDTASADYWRRLEQECAEQVFLHPTPSQHPSPCSPQKLPEATSPSPHLGFGFPFPHPFPDSGATMLYPPPLLTLAQRRICWSRYVDNVDPLLKILHKPTVEGLITVRDVHHYKMHPSTGALVQAVCLLAVISMSETDVHQSGLSSSGKEPLLRDCASRLEQALMAANFLDTRDLTTMQALLLYLYYLKHKQDPKLYSLRGMTIFLAARLGLNRDRSSSSSSGATSRLEVELRRRLWWQLITLVDHPDDCATDYAPPSVGADTRLPLNVNDSELEQPHTCADGRERRGFTESSFCLMQYEVTRLFNRIRFERAQSSSSSSTSSSSSASSASASLSLNLSSSISSGTGENPSAALAGAEERLHSSRQRIASRYFQAPDREDTSEKNNSHQTSTSTQLTQFAADAIAMILAKRRVIMYIAPDINGHLSTSSSDHLFLLAIHVLELSRALQTANHFAKWRWLNDTYFQWSVASYVAKDLCRRAATSTSASVTCPATRRAWSVLDGILDSWPEATRASPKAVVLRDLIANAARAREELTVWDLGLHREIVEGRGDGSSEKETLSHTTIGAIGATDPITSTTIATTGWPQNIMNQTLGQTLGQEELFVPEPAMYDGNLLNFDLS